MSNVAVINIRAVKRAMENDGVDWAVDVGDLIRTAFKHRDHAFMAGTDGELQHACIGAVLLGLTESGRSEDVGRIERELALHRALQAASEGVPVDFEQLVSHEDKDDAVGIAAIWWELTKDGVI